jgi:hypothetical protein
VLTLRLEEEEASYIDSSSSSSSTSSQSSSRLSWPLLLFVLDGKLRIGGELGGTAVRELDVIGGE